MTTRIEVDFNSRDDEGRLPALIQRPRTRLKTGTVVQAYDDEGYRCVAVVSSVRNGYAALDPLWQTFAAPGESIVSSMRTSLPDAVEWKNQLTMAFYDRVAHALRQPNVEGPQPARLSQPVGADA
jgi:hypothetical protein